MKVTYLSLSRHFSKVKDLDVKNVGKLIGGKVEQNTMGRCNRSCRFI